jgi:hypothetical protein
MRELSIEDVADIIEEVPDLSEMMLIGGQALNYWAETLGLADAESTAKYGPATSKDIDFLASVAAVRSFAKAVDGQAYVANMDDAFSPNSGVVAFDFQGETREIDFLANMAGFTTTELATVRKWAHVARLRETSTSSLSVMHPMHCLQAQLENIYGTLNRRDSEDGLRYVSRVRLAIEACRRLTAKSAAEDDTKTATAIAEHVHALSYLKSALRARHQDGLRIEDGIYAGPEMPSEFLRLRIPQMHRLLVHKVKKYEELQAREIRRSSGRAPDS